MTHDPVDLLRAAGLEPGEELGRGMEGVVHALRRDSTDTDDDDADALVAKVWHRRSAAEVERLRVFTDAVARADLPVAMPRVLEVRAVAGVPISVERRLTGTPMVTTPPPWPLTDAAIDTMLDCLAALAGAGDDPDLAVLPLLPGEPARDPTTETFGQALAALVRRRAALSAGPLSQRHGLTDVADLAERTASRLEGLPDIRIGLVHGDLFPANVLLADDGRTPAAILDVGFLTTLGDPAFDAAVTASVFDMWSPDHRRVEAALDAAVAERFGHPAEVIALHRAAYALVTATVYAPDASDGHAAWCVAMLGRDDVRDAMG